MTIAQAIKQRLGKQTVDDWIKSFIQNQKSPRLVQYIGKLFNTLPVTSGFRFRISQSISNIADREEVMFTFYYHNLLDCMYILLCHILCIGDCVQTPAKKLANKRYSKQLYQVLKNSHYLLTEQEQLPNGVTIVPIICCLYEALLTTSTRDQSAWLLYRIIGNIPKHVQRKQSAVVMVIFALLPNSSEGISAASTRASL